MKIFITGGTGFVGRALVNHLISAGHQVTILSRRGSAVWADNPRRVQGDPAHPGPWQEILREHEAVINLAGASIFCRWNAPNRREIMDSRIVTTQNIVTALRSPESRVRVLLNGSAVGYYGNRGDAELTEESAGGAGFLAEICSAWENAAQGAEALGVRVVRCRLGVVLGRDGGALAKMAPLFRAGLGARLGDGRQWFPWIHLKDLLRIITLLLDDPQISGPVNCVAPAAVTNHELSRTLAAVLHRPLFLPPLPAFFLKILQGEASALLLDSLKVSPTVLTRAGFTYNFPTLSAALTDLLPL